MSLTTVHRDGWIPASYNLSSSMVWLTTSNAFWLSSVIRNRGALGLILVSALASETINADIIGDNPFVNPNCRDDCSKFFDNRGNRIISNSLPRIGVTVIPL